MTTYHLMRQVKRQRNVILGDTDMAKKNKNTTPATPTVKPTPEKTKKGKSV